MAKLGHWWGEGVGSCMRMVWSMCRMGLRNRGSSEELKEESEIAVLCLSLGVSGLGVLRRGGMENPISGCGLIEFDIMKGVGRQCGHGYSLSGMVWGI